MRTFTTLHSLTKQSGVSVVTAIFLVVVLALMGAGMVSLLTTSQQSTSQEYTSAKTYMAGRSCLQWAMYQAIYSAAAGNYTNTFNDANANLFNTQCNTTDINIINSDSLVFFNIESTSEFGAAQDPEYSQRNLRLQFQPAPP